ncbi:MAG TPA: nucleotide exchange factor GrpE [Chloroflexi bacterium]|nr:nucleotide exchange factor GrpE [Chloroflexota bacterium]
MDESQERQDALGQAPEEQPEHAEAAPTPADEVAQWRAKADEYLDKYRRSVADFANYRKRQDRERENETRRITMQVLRRLLPPLDDLDRALESIPPEHQENAWIEGIQLIDRKLRAILEDFGVTPIEALGKPFDPHYHSALLQEESDTYPEGTVMEELQRGYMLDNEVLRHTVVKVSKGPGTANGETQDNG